MKEFLTLLLGEGSLPQLAAAHTFAFLGAILMLLLTVRQRDPNSPRTPEKFSFKFMMCDNAARITATIILIFIFIRFSREIVGTDITMWIAFGIGFGSDKLAEILKNKGILTPKK